MLTYNSPAYNIIEAERRAIAHRDLFTVQVEHEDIEPVLADDYDEATDNPMAAFLRELQADVDELAAFESWHPYGSPRYAICFDTAVALAEGESDLATAIITGAVPLYKMPAELRRGDVSPARVAWIRAQAENASRLAKAFLAELGVDFVNQVPEQTGEAQ
jgi:hypothetical protein